MASLFLSANLHAAVVTWTVDAVGDLGQTVTGTFDNDASLGTGSAVSVTNVDIQVSGGSSPSTTTAHWTANSASATYDLSGNTPNASFSDVLLLLSWPNGGPLNSVLTDAGGTYDLDSTGPGASRMVLINNNIFIGESFITGTISAPIAVPAELTNDEWIITGVDAFGIWDGSTIHFETQVQNGLDLNLTGYFDWIGSGNATGSFGRENFTGTLFSDNRIELIGFEIVPPSQGIGLGAYSGKLSATGTQITDGIWGVAGGNIITGAWSAISLSSNIVELGDLNIINDAGNPSDGLRYLDMSYSDGLTLEAALIKAQATYPNARIATASEFDDLFSAAGIPYSGVSTASDGFLVGADAQIAGDGCAACITLVGQLGGTIGAGETLIWTDPDGSNDPASTRDIVRIDTFGPSGALGRAFLQHATFQTGIPGTADYAGFLLVSSPSNIVELGDLNIINDAGNPSDGLRYLDMSYSDGLTLEAALVKAQATYPNARIATASEFDDLFSAAGIPYSGASTASDGFLVGADAQIAGDGCAACITLVGQLGGTIGAGETLIWTDPDGSSNPASTRDIVRIDTFGPSGARGRAFLQHATFQTGIPGTADYAGFLLVSSPVVPTTPVDLSGTIKTINGEDVCAIVLASGQFMFSCNPIGELSLTNLPRENNGTVKRQIYADGFFPKIDILPGSSNEEVVMTLSGTCPSYNTPYDPGFVPGSAGKRINIAGRVLTPNGQTPICAIVLANGQFMFSCDGTGSYALNIPLDTNGQFKLQVYADGFAPTIQTFDEFKAANDVRMAQATECQ